jgi:hypothetical protein
VFSYDPAVGPSSLQRYDLDGPSGVDGGARDAEVAPDGTVWVARGNGVARFSPHTRRWTLWNVTAAHLAVQPKPSGGYYVWAEYHESFLFGSVARYDSVTGVWTDMPAQGGRGRIFILQEKDAVDDAGNVWAYDIGDDVFNDPLTMGYLQPDGLWIEVPTPWPLGDLNECAAFKAYGSGRAICASSGGTVFGWDGASWTDLGIGGGQASAIEAVDVDVASETVWTTGAGGAARRDPESGLWQRYRITNCSQGDNFALDLSLTPTGELWTTANIGTGVGGFQHFDGPKVAPGMTQTTKSAGVIPRSAKKASTQPLASALVPSSVRVLRLVHPSSRHSPKSISTLLTGTIRPFSLSGFSVCVSRKPRQLRLYPTRTGMPARKSSCAELKELVMAMPRSKLRWRSMRTKAR